jgi:hypothetical protein
VRGLELAQGQELSQVLRVPPRRARELEQAQAQVSRGPPRRARARARVRVRARVWRPRARA